MFEELNVSKNKTIEINYLEDHGFIYIPYMALSFVGIVVGTLGNLVVLGSILRSRKLRSNPTYMLLANLALSDLGISTLVHTFTNVGILHGEHYFRERMALCIFLGSWCLIACATSLFNMGFLALNRYLNICHNQLYGRLFTWRNSVAMCALAWLCGCLVDLPNFVGWGGHFFDPKSANCMWNRLASPSYSVFFPTTAIFIPCAAIGICYARIFVFARRKTAGSTATKSKDMSVRRMKRSLAIAKSLFASFALFTVCWVPYGLVIAFGYQDHFPMSVHATVTFMAHINSTMNAVFYMALNPAFSLKTRITNSGETLNKNDHTFASTKH
nr:G protein-coupled receptor [Proales similis]